MSIIVPAFNEERRLPDALAKLARFLDELQSSAEVVVVDDGSTDKTASLVRDIAARDVRFRLLSNPGNRGKGYAVRHGMLKARGEWRLMTDADLSTPIDEFQKLYEAAHTQSAAVVIGSRAVNRALVSKRQALLRDLGGRFFNLIMRLLTRLPFADTQCGFKLYRADAAEAVFARQILDGFSFDVEALFIARKLEYKILEVPVRWANVEGTKVTALATARAFLDLWRIRGFAWKGRYDQLSTPLAARAHQ
ncbi:MAG TPA: dolichyl-phosphate beta-glucosyltransferase [Bryobacteraceae bacterium]|nr:dolichyl-phosphate beta-glucosyltransferase [Bryobacteraceae bacterium]